MNDCLNKDSQNELAKELFNIGFFNPQNAMQSLSALEIMDFDGKAAIEAKIRQIANQSREVAENDTNNGARAEEFLLPEN